MTEGNQSHIPTSPGELPREPSEKPAPRPRSNRRQRNSVFQYIAILFAAAFILLLFTFLMERRQHQLLQEENQEQIDTLQQSVSAVQSLQNLYNQNDALKEEVADLEKQVEDLERKADDLESQAAELSDQLAKTQEAMDYFWQIDEAYVRGRYTLCRSLIQSMEDAEQGSALKEYLSKESATDTDRLSPYDRYQEIYNALY